MPSGLELMVIHADALFMHDAMGRMTFLNELPHDVAPRLYMGSTRGGNVVRYLDTLGADAVGELGRLLATGFDGNLAGIINIMGQSRQVSDIWIGPAYVFPDERNRPTRATRITHQNRGLLLPHFPFTHEELEYRQPCYAIVQDGIAVSICCSARQTSMAAEASVFTLPEFRGRAYGMDAANDWAAEVQGQGRLALYSTSWDNFPSQAVARKLRLIQYGMDIQIN